MSEVCHETYCSTKLKFRRLRVEETCPPNLIQAKTCHLYHNTRRVFCPTSAPVEGQIRGNVNGKHASRGGCVNSQKQVVAALSERGKGKHINCGSQLMPQQRCFPDPKVSSISCDVRMLHQTSLLQVDTGGVHVA